MDSGSFARNRADVNIQQQNTLEVSNTETVMSDNEEIYPPPPQDILNVFATAELSSCSSSDSDKYKRAWIKTKVIRCSILYARKFPETCSRELSIALNYKGIASIMAVTGAISPKKYQCNYPI